MQGRWYTEVTQCKMRHKNSRIELHIVPFLLLTSFFFDSVSHHVLFLSRYHDSSFSHACSSTNWKYQIDNEITRMTYWGILTDFLCNINAKICAGKIGNVQDLVEFLFIGIIVSYKQLWLSGRMFDLRWADHRFNFYKGSSVVLGRAYNHRCSCAPIKLFVVLRRHSNTL